MYWYSLANRLRRLLDGILCRSWVGTDIDVGTILGISENAYRHTQPEKTRKIIIFAFNKRKNYRLTIKIEGHQCPSIFWFFKHKK